jgi:hypothetical protein
LRRILLILVCLLGTTVAEAHQASVSWSRVHVGEDGTIDYQLRLSTRDLYEALGLDRDREASDDEVRAGEARLVDYVLARVHVAGGSGACPVERRGLTVADHAVEVSFAARCRPPLATVTIDYDLFFDLDPRHSGLLVVEHGAQRVEQEFTRNSRHFEWGLDLAAPASLGLVDYLGKGIEHIYSGYDHIAFLVGLLLVAAVGRGLRQAIPYTVKIVTAFTLAHSCTLILAALDVVSLPSRLVESAIAASIVYVAVENVVLGEPRRRAWLAFGFGLVHGLGFAAMLRPILPSTGVVVPLLAFNLGVEIGQVSIVVAVLPIVHVVARRRRWVVVAGSVVVGLLGALWLVERVLDVSLL